MMASNFHSHAGIQLVKRVCFPVFILAMLSITTPKSLADNEIQPFPVPAWLGTTHRRLVFDIYGEEKWSSQGAQISCSGTNASGFFFVWDGKDRIYNFESGEDVDLDRHRKQVEEAHRLGMKVLCPLMRFWHPDLLINDHPEWQELPSPDSKPVTPEDRKKNPKVQPNGCWISPFGDFYIKQCALFVEKFGWDGYNLDGFGTFAICHCPTCREIYPRETGRPLPDRVDVSDLDFRKYVKWRLNKWDEFVYRWQKTIKGVNPGFAAVPWSTGPGRWWHWTFPGVAECSERANRLVDAPILELFWDFPPGQESNLLPSFVVRYYLGLTAERPVFMLPYLCTQGQNVPIAPAVERDFRLLSVIANGALPVAGIWQLGNEVPLKHYMDLQAVREPFTIGAKSVKWAALLVSESSRLFHGIPSEHSKLGGAWIGSGIDTPDASSSLPSQRRLPAHLESALGIFRAFNEDHLPLDIITEADVADGERLSLYQVLILPNAGCLSDLVIEGIRRFVAKGGGLIALQESSLFDDLGSLRNDFGLKDLFGVSFQKLENHTAHWPAYENTTLVSFTSHPITEDPVIEDTYRTKERKVLDFIGMTTQVSPQAGTKVIGFRGKDEGLFKKARETGSVIAGATPFLVLNETAKGRVAYFANDVGQAYFTSPYQYERRLITGAARWAAGEVAPPMSVEAPMCVQATYFEQESPQRTIVHLLNEINSTAGRALPPGSPPMREEIVPIRDITIRFKDRTLKQTFLEPEHEQLQTRMDGKDSLVNVPELRLHSMVVAE